MVIEGVLVAGLVTGIVIWSWRRRAQPAAQPDARPHFTTPQAPEPTATMPVSFTTPQAPAPTATMPVSFPTPQTPAPTATMPVSFTPQTPEPTPTMPVSFTTPQAPAPTATMPVSFKPTSPEVPAPPSQPKPSTLSFDSAPSNAAPVQDLWLGQVVGGYTLLEKVGEGGIADVYRVRSKDDQHDLAFKLLKEPFSRDPAFQRRVAREVTTCKDLRHPNIMALVDWSPEDAPVMFLVLEYVDGGTLTRRLRPEGLSLEEVTYAMSALIDGLSYAHQRGVVHRDLKPDNVMLTSQGEIKIADFGLARTKDGEQITQAGQSMGTPAYFPPEQIIGAEPTPAADQYSLGVMLYEMLTGHRPFQETHPMKLLMCHIYQQPDNPLTYRPDLHPTLSTLTLRMLEKDPERRFSQLQTVKDALVTLNQGQDWQLPESERLPDEIAPAAPPQEIELRLRDQ